MRRAFQWSGRPSALEDSMIDVERNSRFLAAVAIAIAVITATYIGASRWESVRNKPKERSLKVTGSAKKRILSDLAEWSATITVVDPDRTAAYRSVHDQMGKTRAFLVAKGFKDDQVRASSVVVNELNETETVGTGEQRVERKVFKGYRVMQAVSITSTDVPKVERVSREITELLDQGVAIESSPPAYYYTKLGDLKIEMLASASKDARTRADNIVKSAGGGSVGKLMGADMGVINVNPANSTETSWEGNNDTSSLEKDIITIVHITYQLK